MAGVEGLEPSARGFGDPTIRTPESL